MAWVTDGIEEDEEDTRTYDKMELGVSDETSSHPNNKKLSTIAESSSYVREMVGESLLPETDSSRTR